MIQQGLIIDGDHLLAQTLQEYLQAEGLSIEMTDRRHYRSLLTKGTPALIILNIISFDQGHLELLRQLRTDCSSPLLALLDFSDAKRTAQALEAGADSCLLKPLHPRELVARFHSLERRLQSKMDALPSEAPSLFEVGGLMLDRNAWSASINQEPLSLTLFEFQLLSALLDPPGCVKKRRELVEAVLDKKYDSYDRSLDVHICNLRRKLGSPYQERLKTIRGIGFIFETAEQEVSTRQDLNSNESRANREIGFQQRYSPCL